MLGCGVEMAGEGFGQNSVERLRMLKSSVRALLLETRLRAVAAPVHRATTTLELALVRLHDSLRAEPERLSIANSKRITAIVKTFERPAELRRLLASLRKFFPCLPVIVADDSRHPIWLKGVRTIALPFDSGVSAGRQAALSAVDTEYTWILDDDFVLYRSTRLARCMATLDANPSVDILGGPVIDLPLGIKRDSVASAIYPTAAAPVAPLGSMVGGLPVRDKVPNFFIARTDRLRLVGWDQALKRLDHADFFTRARGVLLTVYDDEFRCLHAQAPFDAAYMKARNDLVSDAALLRARYGLRD